MSKIRSLQELQYEFPYHYLPYLQQGVPRLHRCLSWGLEYLTYTSFVVELIRRSAPESLLDLGCGDGRLIDMIENSVPQVSGVDLSERAIAFARAFNPGIEFMCTDIATLSAEYECVTLIEVLEHIPDEQYNMAGFVRNVARLVKRDGRLLVSVPTINVPVNRKHYRHYDLALLEATLEPFFKIERHWWLYRRGMCEQLLRSMLVNRFYILNWTPLLALMWRIHYRRTYFADALTGAHLVCVAKPVCL